MKLIEIYRRDREMGWVGGRTKKKRKREGSNLASTVWEHIFSREKMSVFTLWFGLFPLFFFFFSPVMFLFGIIVTYRKVKKIVQRTHHMPVT